MHSNPSATVQLKVATEGCKPVVGGLVSCEIRNQILAASEQVSGLTCEQLAAHGVNVSAESVEGGGLWVKVSLPEPPTEKAALAPFVQNLWGDEWIQAWSDGRSLSVAASSRACSPLVAGLVALGIDSWRAGLGTSV